MRINQLLDPSPGNGENKDNCSLNSAALRIERCRETDKQTDLELHCAELGSFLKIRSLENGYDWPKLKRKLAYLRYRHSI